MAWNSDSHTTPRQLEPIPAVFSITVGNRKARLSYQKTFAIGYQLWLKRRYDEAAKVFTHLSHLTDRGPRAHILLAHCRAMLGDYAACAAALSVSLPTEIYGRAADELHGAFVSWKCAMYRDVKQGLETLATEHPELPTVCLILADFMGWMGSPSKPLYWLKEAQARDRVNGAIAQIAKRKIATVEQDEGSIRL